MEKLTKSTSVYMKEILQDKTPKQRNKNKSTGPKNKINFNRKKIKETIAKLEDESNKSSYDSAQSAEELKIRIAEIVRTNNATESSLDKVNSFLALQKI